MKKEEIEQRYFKTDNNEEIMFFLKRKIISNFYMKVSKKNEIIVSVPYNANEKDINDFIYKYIEKIYRKISLINENKFLNEEEKWFYLFGEKKFFSIIGNHFYFDNKKKIINKNSIEKIILFFYKKELLEYVLKRQEFFEYKMNLAKHNTNVFLRKGIWGINYTKKNIIRYSSYLASYSYEIIDYVIIHELSHDKIQGHDKDFWNLVNSYDPYWKIKRKCLKNKIFTWMH
ncbi:MAG: YgjP-like metallopeptidase domain-containing protein [Metamycoplasmataceae bacterium]